MRFGLLEYNSKQGFKTVDENLKVTAHISKSMQIDQCIRN